LVLILIVLLLLASAAMSGSEVAFFSLSPNQISELRAGTSHREGIVKRFLNQPERLLATILTANNFVNVGIVVFTTYLSNELFDFSANVLVGFVVNVIIITSLILLFGEILPKVYASQKPVNVVLSMAVPLLWAHRLCKPIVELIVGSSGFINKVVSRKSSSISMDELSDALELTGNSLTEEKDILQGIIKFGNISVSSIMVARVDIVDIDISSDFEEVIAIIVESGFSRIPVYDKSPDNIKGVLYIKDLLSHIHKGKSFRWQSLIRPPYFVPVVKKIDDLLAEFQLKKIHMAIVIDEYGGTLGIVTLEDVIEEIVGEISDEYDEEERNFVKLPDGSYIFEGRTMLGKFEEVLSLNHGLVAKYSGEADTLAGMILEITEEMPKKNDIIAFDEYNFKILSADERRIKKVGVSVRRTKS